jgi:hypothetical protein
MTVGIAEAMPKTIAIKLGGTSYTIPALDIGQIRRACEFMQEGQVEAFGFLQIALERATPKPPSFDGITFDLDEITTAVQSVMKFCGLSQKENVNG